MKATQQQEVKLLAEEAVITQEKLIRTDERRQRLAIGIPQETSLENRIALTPEAAAVITSRGHEVVVEAGAGKSARYEDREYSDAGARIVYSAQEAFDQQIVLKVGPPTVEETGLMKAGGFLISALHLNLVRPEQIKALNQRKITALAYEFLQNPVGEMPVMRAMSEIAGSTVMLIAAEYLSSLRDGKGIIMGGITGVPPTKVLIIGAGAVAEYAARTAIGLGAEVKVFDNHIYKLRRIRQVLNQQIFTSTIHTGILNEAIMRADVVIGAMRAEEGRTPVVITEEMIASMNPGSVVIDVSIDHGGCIETSVPTTHENPVFVRHGVIHYCVPNIASRVARTASMALSNIFSPILLKAAELGGFEELIFAKDWFMKGIYTYKGSLTNAHIARRLNMQHRDMKLLKAARF